ncbi:MAG: hypothetical protein RL059_1078 [Bacteroidota bacterium]|jgi:hypothetical protein
MTYNLNDYIDFEGDPTIDYVEVSLPYACIPNSSYNISDKNNMLNITFDTLNYTYIFPNGNYTVNTFMAAWALIVPSSISISYNSTTAKFTLSSTSYPFSVNAQSTLDYVIGFSGTTVSTVSLPYTLVMPRCVDFLPEPVYNICSPEISNGQALANGGVFQFSNILATIPNTGKLSVQTVYQNNGDEFILKSNSYNKITIQILSDEGQYIDFNGLATFFALRFKIHRKIPKIRGTFLDIVERSTRINNLDDFDESQKVEMQKIKGRFFDIIGMSTELKTLNQDIK